MLPLKASTFQFVLASCVAHSLAFNVPMRSFSRLASLMNRRPFLAQSRPALFGRSRPISCTAVSDAPAQSLALAAGRLKVQEIFNSQQSIVGKEIVVKGWVRTVRNQKAFSFIEVNDGSFPKGIQVVAETAIPTYSVVGQLVTGSAVAIKGTVVESPGSGQKFELKATEVELVGDCSGAEYPLQKKRHSLEFLRSIAHLRPRTNTIASVARVRSALAFATHKFFQERGFLYLQTPLITASDCEGAGEMFRVTTLPSTIAKLPKTKEGEIDYAKDFFGKPAFLTVSGQA